MKIEETGTEATQTDTTPTDQASGGQGGESTSSDASESSQVTLDADQQALAAFEKGASSAASDDDALSPQRTAADVADDAVAKSAADAPAPAGAPAAAAAPAPAAVDPDAVVENEIKTLGLKSKAAERFREMTESLKTKDKELEPLKQSKQQLDEWNGYLRESTVSPQQLGMMIEVGKALNGTDIAKKTVAFNTMKQTLVELGQQLGLEVPGLVDPLEGHADLKAAVDNGDVTPQIAKEMAQQRAAAKHAEQTSVRATEEQQFRAAVQTANQQLSALGTSLKNGNAAAGVVADPFFEMKMQMLAPTLEIIQNSMHPSKWAEAAARAYGQLPTPSAPAAAPAVAVRPAVGHMPLRAPGGAANMRPKPKSDLEAFEIGAYGATS